MSLREELEEQGNWLFRWRGLLPLLLIGLFLLAMKDFEYPRGSHWLDRMWGILCFSVSLVGLGVRVVTVGYVPSGTSGRNTDYQEARLLNTAGLYSVVRHPLYLGNFLIWFGVVISLRSWWFCALTALICWFYYERIMYAEEEFLRTKFGEQFLSWARKTPLIWPNVSLWRNAGLPFDIKKSIRKEYTGLFAVICVFALLDLIQETIIEKHLQMDVIWICALAAGTLLYLSILVLKKKTKLLTGT